MRVKVTGEGDGVGLMVVVIRILVSKADVLEVRFGSRTKIKIKTKSLVVTYHCGRCTCCYSAEG